MHKNYEKLMANKIYRVGRTCLHLNNNQMMSLLKNCYTENLHAFEGCIVTKLLLLLLYVLYLYSGDLKINFVF